MEDYTKYSETSEETKDEIVTLTVNQDYHFDEPIDDNIIKEGMDDITVDETEETEIIEKGDTKLIGVVSGFTRLNVREKPNKNSKVLCVLNRNEEVEISTEEEDTEDFYAIITTGKIKVKGYCMKDYIEIK